MTDIITIQATSNDGGSQVDENTVRIDENIGVGTLVGTLIGCSIPGLTFVFYGPDDQPLEDWLYEVVEVVDSETGAVSYQLKVLNAGAGDFDHENQANGGVHSFVLRAYQGTTLVAEGQLEVELNDVNDAPTGPVLDNDTIGDDALTDDVVGRLHSTDQDGNTITFKFKYTNESNQTVYSDTSEDGLFKIDGAGNIVVADDALLPGHGVRTPTYEVVAKDTSGGESSSVITITIADNNNPPAAPEFTGGEVDESIGTDAAVGTLTASDPDQEAVSFVFEETGTNISGDGLFRIESDGRIVVVNSDNIQVPAGVPYNEYFYTVIARDAQVDGGSTEIRIQINNLPDNANRLPSAPRWDDGVTGVINETVGASHVVGDLFSEDPDGGQVTFKFRYFDEASQQFVLRDVSQDNAFKIVSGEIVVNDWAAIQVDGDDGNFTYDVVAIDDDGGETIGPVTVTVLDIPNVVGFDADTVPISLVESNDDVITYTYTLRRTNNFGETKVAWSLSGDVDRADFPGFALPSGEAIFQNGSYTTTITITVSGDTTYEPDEDFTITLLEVTGGEGAIGPRNTASGTIENDDEEPTLPTVQFGNFLEPEILEGHSGTRTVTFQVVRDSTAGSPVVHWQVSGSQVNAADFAGGIIPSGEITFAAGSFVADITIQIAGDVIFEPHEQFFVTLTSAEGAVIGNRSVVGAVIFNDDTQPTVPVVQFDQGSLRVEKLEGADPSVTEYVFTIRRDALGPAKVNWHVTGLTADVDDFGGALPSGEVVFAQNSETAEIRFFVHGDAAVEPDETFQVWLTPADDSAAIGNESVAIGVIKNDDAPPAPVVEFDSSTRTVDKTEGDSGTVTFIFKLVRNAVGDPSKIAWSVSIDGLTADAADFGGTLPSGLAEFGADDVYCDITFTIASDKLDESGIETFLVILEEVDGGNATVGAFGIGIGNILDDDETPTVPGWQSGDLGVVHDTVEGGSAVGNLNSTDGDGDPITYLFKVTVNGQVVYSDVSHDGKFKIVGGRVVTNGDIQIVEGPDEQELTYTIVAQDGNGNESEGEITVTIVDRNRPPAIVSVVADGNGEPGAGDHAGFIVVSELDPLGIIAKVTANDPDVNQTVTYSLENYDELFSIDAEGYINVINRALLSVTQHTPYLVQVKVEDGAGGFVLQTVQIKVLNEVDPNNLDPEIESVDPVDGRSQRAADGAIEVGESISDGAIAVVNASDPENATLIYGLEDDFDGLFHIDEATGEITIDSDLIPDSDFNQTFTLVIAVSDGTTGSARQTVTVRVLSANQSPEIASIVADENGQDGTYDGGYAVLVGERAGTGTIAQVSASDPNNDTLTYSLANTYGDLFDIDQNGRIFVANGTRLGVDDDTPYRLTVVVSDGRGDPVMRDVWVVVVNDDVPGNNEPDITGIVASGVGRDGETGVIRVASTAQVGEIGITVAEDVDTTDTLTYALVDNHGGRFGIDASSGKIVFLEPFSSDDVGETYVLRVQVFDGNGGTDFHDVTIEVVANAAPDLEITAGREETVVGPNQPALAFDGIALTDDENDELTLTISFDADQGTLAYTNVTGVRVFEDDDLSDGTNTFTVVGTKALLETFLDGLSFTSAAPGGTVFDLTLRDSWHQDVLYNDAILVTAEATAGNDLPVFLVEGSDEFLAASNEDRNAFAGIALSDDENDNLILTIRYQSTGTTLTPSIITGVLVDSDTTDPDGFRTITLSGKFRALNNYLDALKFQADAPGVTTFDFTLKDAAHDATIHNGAITVTVEANPGNDAPVVTIADSTVDAQVDAATAIFAEALGGVVLHDDENADLTLKISFDADNGTLAWTNVAGVTVTADPDVSDGVYTLTLNGKYDKLNEFLGGLKFDAGIAGDTVFDFELSDGVNNTVVDNGLTVTATEVPPVNTRPTGVLISNDSVLEMAARTTIVGELTATDNEGGPMRFVLTDPAGGRFMLSGSAETGWTLQVDRSIKLDFEDQTVHEVKIKAIDSGNLESDEISLFISIRNLLTESTTGTAAADLIKGGVRGDRLGGGGGNDTLHGGAGNDVLTGNAGADAFVFDVNLNAQNNVDEITDFTSGIDKIRLSQSIFTEIFGIANDPNVLHEDAFRIGFEAQDEDDRIIYDDQTGALMYDFDGTGDEAPILFALLSNLAIPSASDFIIIP